MLLNFGDKLIQLFIIWDVAFDILINEAAHLFVSVDIQLGCILDPEDGVSMRSSGLQLDSDGIVD